MNRFKRILCECVSVLLILCTVAVTPIDSYAVSKESSSKDSEVPESLVEAGMAREKKTKLKGKGKDKVTIMIYMNGSDLESDDQEATKDLQEMIAAGKSKNVNIVVQTMGTRSWSKKFGISSSHTQRYLVNGDGLKLVDDKQKQLDCTKAETLQNFVKWSAKNYPANRYILLFWNHGGGPVYGFGYDEWNDDETASLSVDEMQTALKNAGVYFDFIGMDCCIMSSMETCCALYDFCDYMILSEDFESGLGWSYTGWLKALYKNTSIATADLGKIICDDFVQANEESADGDESILAVIDQSMLKILYKAWQDFAYENSDELLGNNYSRKILRKRGGRLQPALRKGILDWLFEDEDSDDANISDYYISDIMALAQNIDSDASDTLAAAVAQTLVYVKSTDGDADLTGIAVTLPYGDEDFYDQMAEVFANIGIDDDYVSWLEDFIDVEGECSDSYYDYDDYDWDGWDDYEDDYDWDEYEDEYEDDWDDDYDWDLYDLIFNW